MSVQILKEPFELTLSNNPIIYKLKVNDFLNADNIYPSFTKTLSRFSKPGEGWGFTIIDPLTDQDIVFYFTAVPSPDNSGNYYHDNSVGGFIFPYIDLIISDFKKNSLLITYFDIVRDGLDIIFTAKQPIKELIHTNGTLRSILPGAPFTSTSVDSNHYKVTKKKNYHILISLFYENEYLSDNWENIIVLKEIPDNNGIITFDLSSVLNLELKSGMPQLPLASLNDNGIKKTNLLRRYYINYSTSFDEKKTVSNLISFPIKYTHFGGISLSDFGDNNIVSYLQGYKKFLSWSENKKLHTSQKDWLTFMNFTNSVNNFKVKLKLFFKNGTTNEILLDTINLQKWECLIIPVGYEQRNIQSLAAGLNVFKWQIFILDQANQNVTEFKTYYLDCNTYICKKTLTFLNAFNCPETLLTIGEWTENLKIKRTFGNKTLSDNYKTINGQIFQFDNESSLNYKVRTGYLKKNEIAYYQDVLINNNLFLTKQIYTPVVITTKTIKITECLTFLNQLEFDLKKSMKIKNYSNQKRTINLSIDYDCGGKSISVDVNGLKVSTFGNLSLYKNNIYQGSIIYNSTAKKYIFSGTLIQDYKYKYEVQFTLDSGEVLTYSKDFRLNFEKSNFITNSNTNINFQISTFQNTEELFVDYGEASSIQQTTIDNTINNISFSLFTLGSKLIKLYTPCPNNIRWFSILFNNVKNIDITAFKKLTFLRIAYSTLDNGGFDISNFPDLEQVFIINSSYTSIEIGLHRNINYFVLSNNLLNSDEIEAILLKIWKYRGNYKTTLKYIYLQGNIGSGPNMTAKALDIINGAGIYIGEGLQTNYNFNVIY